MTESRTPYPVRVDASPDPVASRGLWLIKWLLLIPHYIVLAFLWIGFIVVSVIAFFAILFTGRYPRTLFDYNVGVLRWSWRVHYYGYAALGTDRYPPFSLADVPDYPAHLAVPYPQRLSRGLVLVKWWLLAIPHYLILAVFIGGGVWFGTRGWNGNGAWNSGWGVGGLVGLLVLIVGIVLLFSGGYPRPLYDFVLGMDRWVLRVATYVGLMTDAYPPFRLDVGGPDPGSVPVGPTPPPPEGVPAAAAQGRAPAPVPAQTWTAGRVVSLVIGSVLLLAAAGCLVGGGTLLWADRTQRDGGYLFTPNAQIGTTRFAVTSDSIQFDTGGSPWVLDQVLGKARPDVTPGDPDVALFVGIASTADVTRYLDGVGYAQLSDLGPAWGQADTGPAVLTDRPGGAPSTPPGDLDIWAAHTSGQGMQQLTWRPADGDWTLVVMRADGASGVAAEVRLGATAPGLPWLAAGILALGLLFLVAGILLVVGAVRRAQAAGPVDWPRRSSVPPPRTPADAETAGIQLTTPDSQR